jgi:hypothetical protein
MASIELYMEIRKIYQSENGTYSECFLLSFYNGIRFFEHHLNKKICMYYIPAKWWPGFLFRSPEVIIMVERKGQTRNWPIIASLPAGKFYNPGRKFRILVRTQRN